VHVSSICNASAGQEEIIETNSSEVTYIYPFTSFDMSANYRKDAMNSLTQESTVLDLQ
jgi:hypothetical protein